MNSIHFKSDQYIEVVSGVYIFFKKNPNKQGHYKLWSSSSEVISVFAGFKVQTLYYMAVQMQ